MNDESALGVLSDLSVSIIDWKKFCIVLSNDCGLFVLISTSIVANQVQLDGQRLYTKLHKVFLTPQFFFLLVLLDKCNCKVRTIIVLLVY